MRPTRTAATLTYRSPGRANNPASINMCVGVFIADWPWQSRWEHAVVQAGLNTSFDAPFSFALPGFADKRYPCQLAFEP